MIPEASRPQPPESIKSGIWPSVAFHGFIFSFFLLKSVFFTPETIDYTAAVRVDLVGLPDKIENKPLSPVTKEAAKPEPAPKAVEKVPEKVVEKLAEKPTTKTKPEIKKDSDTVNLNKAKAKDREKAALDKLKAMAALDKIKEDIAQEKPKDDGNGKNKVGDKKIKGNVLSAGTALTGLTKLQHDTYLADLDAHIKKSWSIPEWLSKKDYTAQVRLRIDDRGNILSRQIQKSSGNPSYDAEVLATVDRSAPFPAPPEKFISIVEVDGILIGFPE